MHFYLKHLITFSPLDEHFDNASQYSFQCMWNVWMTSLAISFRSICPNNKCTIINCQCVKYPKNATHLSQLLPNLLKNRLQNGPTLLHEGRIAADFSVPRSHIFCKNGFNDEIFLDRDSQREFVLIRGIVPLLSLPLLDDGRYGEEGEITPESG